MGGFGQNLPNLAGMDLRRMPMEQLNQMYAQTRQKFGPDHPATKFLAQQIAARPPQFQDPYQTAAQNVVTGARRMWAPSGTTAADPRFWEEKAQGAAQAGQGASWFAAPLALPAVAAAPVGALLGMGLGMGAQAGTEYLGEKAGMPPGMRQLAGMAAGLYGGGIGEAAGLTSEDVAAGLTAAGRGVQAGTEAFNRALDYGQGLPERGGLSPKPNRVENAAGINVRGTMGGKNNKLYYPLPEDVEALSKKMNPENPKKAERDAFSALRWRNYDKPAAEKDYGPLVRMAATGSRLERLQSTPEAVQNRIQESRIILAQPLPLWSPKDYGIFDRKLIQQALNGFPGVPQTPFPRSTPVRADISHIDEIYLDPVNRELIKTMIKRGQGQGGDTWYASLYPIKAEVMGRNLKSNYFPQVGGDLFDNWVWGVTPASARNPVPVERSVGNFLRSLVARGIKIEPISTKVHNPDVIREMDLFEQQYGVGLQVMPVHALLASRVLEKNMTPLHVLQNNLTDSYKIPTYGVQTTGNFAFSWVGDVHEAHGETLATRFNPYFRDEGAFGVNEYGPAEKHMVTIGKELGLTGGQAQASRWFGGGDITGLKTPGGDALDLYELQAAYSLHYLGLPTRPQDVQNYLMKLIQEGGFLYPWAKAEPIPDHRMLR